jgi:hypothetical protein
MTSWQKVLTKLLSEFGTTCAELAIEYSAADRLAWDAVKFHKFHDKTYDAYLMMWTADCEHLVAALEKIPSRVCERYEVGSSRFFRYVACDTTLIDLDASRYFDCSGIALTIQLLDEPDSEGFVSYRIDDDELHLSADTLFPSEKATFEGISLPVPVDINRYFAALVSPRWRKEKYNRSIRKERFSVVIDAEYGYQKLTEQASVQNILSSENQKQRQEYLEKETALKRSIKKSTTYGYTADLSYWRFQLWEEYYPRRSQIEAYLATNDLAALEKVLAPCLKKLVGFAKKGLGLYFDPAIHRALLFVSKEKYGEEFTEKWVAAIPDKHYEDVTEVLKRYKINHPLLTVIKGE